MITKLSEVLKSYSVTDKTHGTVKFGPKVEETSKNNVAYLMPKAEGDAVNSLTEPHITIWGTDASASSAITSVEFTWAGAKHVFFSPKTGTFNAPHLTSSDQAMAKTLQFLLTLFLNAATIATIAVTTTTSSSSTSSNSNTNSNANSNISLPGSTSYETEFPSLGGAKK